MARKIKREFPGVTAYFDRHQKRRYRFRNKGFSTEIHGEYASPEFRVNYERAISGYKSQELGAPATKASGMTDDQAVAAGYISLSPVRLHHTPAAALDKLLALDL